MHNFPLWWDVPAHQCSTYEAIACYEGLFVAHCKSQFSYHIQFILFFLPVAIWISVHRPIPVPHLLPTLFFICKLYAFSSWAHTEILPTLTMHSSNFAQFCTTVGSCLVDSVQSKTVFLNINLLYCYVFGCIVFCVLILHKRTTPFMSWSYFFSNTSITQSKLDYINFRII